MNPITLFFIALCAVCLYKADINIWLVMAATAALIANTDAIDDLRNEE